MVDTLQTDEMSGHHHYRSELSFRRKKDLRCTAHNKISSFLKLCMFKKKIKKKNGGEGLLPFTTGNQETTKSDLVTAPSINTLVGKYPTRLALVP